MHVLRVHYVLHLTCIMYHVLLRWPIGRPYESIPFSLVNLHWNVYHGRAGTNGWRRRRVLLEPRGMSTALVRTRAVDVPPWELGRVDTVRMGSQCRLGPPFLSCPNSEKPYPAEHLPHTTPQQDPLLLTALVHWDLLYPPPRATTSFNGVDRGCIRLRDWMRAQARGRRGWV
jgi:hypothetical protein